MDILFARTFLLVSAMLVITTITSRINKRFETTAEMWLTIISTFAFLFAIIFLADVYPLNLLLVAIFAGLIGWEIGPAIEHMGERFKFKKHLKTKGITVKKGGRIPEDAIKEFGQSFDVNQYQREWHNVVFQTLCATSFAVFATSGVVFLTGFDFSFLGSILFVALLILIIMGLLNVFIFRSPLFSLVRAYFGAIIFTFYLFYDFDRLEKMAGDESWATAIDIAVNIYLDIINLFLDLLEILAESD